MIGVGNINSFEITDCSELTTPPPLHYHKLQERATQDLTPCVFLLQ